MTGSSSPRGQQAGGSEPRKDRAAWGRGAGPTGAARPPVSPEGSPPKLGPLVSIKGAGKRQASCSGAAAGVGKSAEQRRTRQAPGSCTGNPYLPLPDCPGGQGATPQPSWHCRALADPSPGKGQLLTWQVVPEAGGGDSQPPDPHRPSNSEHEPPGLPRITERAKGADPAPSEGVRAREAPRGQPRGSEARKPGRVELGAGLFLGRLRCAWFFSCFPSDLSKVLLENSRLVQLC